ncbi:RNA polymerase sigma factor [Sphingomonadaceae bacterium jetA1]|jgi:RNA polymerase sigma-70 factor (ECF subfamily)|uniref:RNA polymerase sigma factor n=1 Tax=Facivitalis istanbulensis TaxID=3075838 RepID=UPI0034797551
MSWLRPIDAWFASAILPHEPDLLRQARRWAADEDEARDLVQEAYVQLFQLTAWDGIANPAAYTVRIIRNCALQRMRRARIVPIRQFAGLEELDLADPLPDSFAVAAGREEWRRLTAGIDALPPACRRVVLMRKFDDMPPRAIAEKLGLSLSTVEKQLARGIELLSRTMRASAEQAPGEPALQQTLRKA